MPFKKGNKLAKGGVRKGGGRKPGPRTELARLALDQLDEEAEKSISFLVRLRNTAKVPWPIRFQAAVNLIDRRFGKPKQSHDIEGGIQLKADQLIEILQEERKERGLPPR